MALTAPDSLILNALSQGISPITGFPLVIADLSNEDVKNALQAGAKALVAASQPKPIETKGKKGTKGPRKPRARATDTQLNPSPVAPAGSAQASLLSGAGVNGAASSH